MKTNITINLFGQLYHIDEDAYELLKKYEENMQRYFSNKEGGDEIIDDIERRVAELLSELQEKDIKAINLSHIQDIIHRIGNPEDFDGDIDEAQSDTSQASASSDRDAESPKESSADCTPKTGRRKLFRDTRNPMVGGVASGIAYYLGMKDPLLVRLVWVMLALFPYHSFLLLYILLWIIMPPALTDADYLQMNGKPVNPQTLNEEIITNAQERQRRQQNSQPLHWCRRILDALLTCCAFALKGIILLFAFSVIITILCAGTSLLALTVTSFSFLQNLPILDSLSMTLIHFCNAQIWQLWTLLGAGTVTIGLPLALLLFRITHKEKRINWKKTHIVCAILWCISLTTTILLAISLSFNLHLEIDEQNRIANTRNGIFLQGGSWEILDAGNWELVELENAQPCIYQYGNNIFQKDVNTTFINIVEKQENKTMKCTLQRTEEAEPGHYILEAIACSAGDGCYLFSKAGGSSPVTYTRVPSKGDSSSQIKNMTWENSQNTAYFRNTIDSTNWKCVQDNCDMEQWNFVSTQPFYHQGGKIRYGITNNTKASNHRRKSHNFSFYDITLTKVSD